jgi:DNA-binding transcriptional ArsR family regulator
MDLFEALAEPHRRALLDLLASGPRSAGELVASQPELTQPTVSRHLKTLREAGLVEVEARAQKRIYAISPVGLQRLDAWLSPYRRFWEESFERLDEYVEEVRTAGGDKEAPGRPGRQEGKK